MKLYRPLCFIDLETTGLDVAKDRIVELGVLKVFPDGNERTWGSRFNPGVPIPAEATAIHGISNEDVAGAPSFEDQAHRILNGFLGCDLAGFNLSNFDIPLLWESFYRAGIEWDLDGTRIIDAGIIFKRREERTLSAAVKFYCGREHVNAHGAISDATATRDVLRSQLERYTDLRDDAESLAAASRYDDQAERVDLAGKFLRRDGVVVFGFGEHLNKPVREQRKYLDWMLSAEFSANTKLAIAKILAESEKTQTCPA